MALTRRNLIQIGAAVPAALALGTLRPKTAYANWTPLSVSDNFQRRADEYPIKPPWFQTTKCDGAIWDFPDIKTMPNGLRQAWYGNPLNSR